VENFIGKIASFRLRHEGNTKEEKNGNVVCSNEISRISWEKGGGGREALACPPSLFSALVFCRTFI
jgi:hypothetical protein